MLPNEFTCFISLQDTCPGVWGGSHCDHIANLSPSSSEAGLATGTEPRKMNPFKFYYLDQP